MNDPSPDDLTDAELIGHLFAWMDSHYDYFRRTSDPATFSVRRDSFSSEEVTVRIDGHLLRPMMNWLLIGGQNLEPDLAREGKTLSAAWESFAVGLEEAINVSPGNAFTLSSKPRQLLEPGPRILDFP